LSGCARARSSTDATPIVRTHNGDKRYVRRDASGHFTDKQVDVGRPLAAGRRSKSKTVAKKGDGDRGDQKRR
jgi:hypothetical protein